MGEKVVDVGIQPMKLTMTCHVLWRNMTTFVQFWHNYHTTSTLGESRYRQPRGSHVLIIFFLFNILCGHLNDNFIFHISSGEHGSMLRSSCIFSLYNQANISAPSTFHTSDQSCMTLSCICSLSSFLIFAKGNCLSPRRSL